MNTRNPTPLQVGSNGTLAGRTYRVAGRIVLSMDDAGGTYYWNEFYLKSDAGEKATLVFEETETGGEWRLFTLFEPDTPITAPEAAARRVGDAVRFDDRDLRVTLVDESRVEFIEGEAPEGVERGDVARYFNAEGANRMFVVSWTGDEVECYRGADLQPRIVAEAFGLSGSELSRLASSPSGTVFAGEGSTSSGSGKFLVVVILIIFVTLGFLIVSKAKWTGRRAAAIHTRAVTAPLALAGSGTIAGKSFQITAHRLVEVAQVGRAYERHEYDLQDADKNLAQLVCGLNAGDPDWWLFTPLNPAEPMTPQRAAQFQVGQIVTVDGYAAPVSELFQTRLRPSTGSVTTSAAAVTVRFGFTARTEQFALLVLWDNSGIQFQRGVRVDAKAVKASFQASAPLEATR